MTGKVNTENPGAGSEEIEDLKLDSRLEKLDAELSKIRQDQATQLQSRQETPQTQGLAMAWRLGSEFVAGVLVGSVIGWLIDNTFGSTPWGLITFLLLGFAAGMLNMLRSAGKIPPPGA